MNADESTNVGQLERLGSVLLGGTLLAGSFKRGRFLGSLMTISGAVMVYRGLTGQCPVYRSLARTDQAQAARTSALPGTPSGEHPPIAEETDRLIGRVIDVVDEASEGSFPASDAPGWTQRRT